MKVGLTGTTRPRVKPHCGAKKGQGTWTTIDNYGDERVLHVCEDYNYRQEAKYTVSIKLKIHQLTVFTMKIHFL